MRQLFINGNLMDLDKDTVIGLTIQANDVSKIDKKKLSVTNSFELPKTANNKRNFEFCDSIGYQSDLPYNELTVNYYDANIHLIDSGKCFLEETKDTYKITVVPNGGVIDVLKNKNFRELLRDNYAPLSGGFTDLNELARDLFDNKTNGYSFGNVAIELGSPPLPDSYVCDGEFSVMIYEVFSYLEDLTGYTFVNADSITDNADFNKLSVPFYDLVPFQFFGGDYDLYLYDDANFSGLYESIKINPEFEYYGEKTALDFIKAIAVMFNCIIDIDNGNKIFKLIAFSDIITGGDIQNWSEKMIENTKKFSIGDYVQNNIINYKHDDGVSLTLGQVIVVCNNENLPIENITEMDIIIPRAVIYSNEYYWYLGTTDSSVTIMTSKCLSEFIFFYDDVTGGPSSGGYYTPFKKCSAETSSGVVTIPAAQSCYVRTILMYDFSANYTEIETILTNPIAYEAEMYLNQLDIYNFKVDNLYKIDELGGVFYVNKIIGYNSKSKQGTKVELIKIK